MTRLLLLAVVMLGGCAYAGGEESLIAGAIIGFVAIVAGCREDATTWRRVVVLAICTVAFGMALAACTPAQAAEPDLRPADRALIAGYDLVLHQYHEAPMGTLSEIAEMESSTESDTEHDGGMGCGMFGMKMGTASELRNRPVSCVELKDTGFAAGLVYEELTRLDRCGRWKSWTTRILCYRNGPRSSAVAKYRDQHWTRLPVWWGTRKLMARLWMDHYGKERS
jgi:hypothetical protein